MPGKHIWEEFRSFIARGSVVDLAVGIIMGAAFTSIVNSLVNDIIMPPVGYAMGGVNFSEFFLVIKAGEGGIREFHSLDAAKKAGAVTINYGLFVNAVLNFLIVAAAVFVLVKNVNRFRKIEGVGAPLTLTEKTLAEIRDLLKNK